MWQYSTVLLFIYLLLECENTGHASFYFYLYSLDHDFSAVSSWYSDVFWITSGHWRHLLLVCILNVSLVTTWDQSLLISLHSTALSLFEWIKQCYASYHWTGKEVIAKNMDSKNNFDCNPCDPCVLVQHEVWIYYFGVFSLNRSHTVIVFYVSVWQVFICLSTLDQQPCWR